MKKFIKDHIGTVTFFVGFILTLIGAYFGDMVTLYGYAIMLFGAYIANHGELLE